MTILPAQVDDRDPAVISHWRRFGLSSEEYTRHRTRRTTGLRETNYAIIIAFRLAPSSTIFLKRH